MTATSRQAGHDVIGAVLAFAARPRVTPAFLSVVHDGHLVLGGWLPAGVTAGDAADGWASAAGRDRPGPARGQPYATGWQSLTEAELRVVRLVIAGLTNREIAGRLYLSWHTVNSHVRHVLQKLDLHRRVDLTRIALLHEPELAQ